MVEISTDSEFSFLVETSIHRNILPYHKQYEVPLLYLENPIHIFRHCFRWMVVILLDFECDPRIDLVF